MKKIRLSIIKNLNALWNKLYRGGIISKGTAITLIHKTTYFLGRKRS